MLVLTPKKLKMYIRMHMTDHNLIIMSLLGGQETWGLYYEARFSFSKLTSGVSGPTKLVHFLAG